MKTEQEIVEEYPEIYEYWHKEADEFEKYPPQITVAGFQHGTGWHGIIESLCEMIDRCDVKVSVTQQKEKFGGLRFYTDGITGDDDEKIMQIFGAIQHAQEMSYHICEKCGDSANVRTDKGWHRTLCEECNQEWLDQR